MHNGNVHRAAANIIVSKSRAARGSVCNVLLSRRSLPKSSDLNVCHWISSKVRDKWMFHDVKEFAKQYNIISVWPERFIHTSLSQFLPEYHWSHGVNCHFAVWLLRPLSGHSISEIVANVVAPVFLGCWRSLRKRRISNFPKCLSHRDLEYHFVCRVDV